MIKKLRIQFICAIMAIATVMLAVILGMVVRFTRENLEMQSISTMRTVASTPHHQGELRRTKGDVRLPFFSVEIGKTGDLIGLDGGYFDLSNREDIQKIVAAAMESPEETGILRRYGLRFLKHQAPKGYTIVFADVTAEVTTIRYLYYNCAVIFLFAMCVFLGVSILLSRWAIRPVERAWEQQRQFVADASHELKTPLSVIMANTELMRREDTTPEERDACAGNVLTTTCQMRDLVENMLDMARVDNGSQKIRFAQVDLSQLVTDSVLSFRLLYEKKELGLDSTIQQGVFLQGSERHLFQVMDVLLDNALKYSFHTPGDRAGESVPNRKKLPDQRIQSRRAHPGRGAEEYFQALLPGR